MKNITFKIVCEILASQFGDELAAEIILDSENPEWVCKFAETIQKISPKMKTKLAEFVIRHGESYQAHYFLSLTRDIPEETQERLLDKMGIFDPEKRKVFRKPST